MTMPDTTIKNWFLVSLDNDGEIIGELLWGIVVEDKKFRWRPGDYVCTSKIIEKIDADLYQTINSKYKCCGLGKEVTLPIEALLELRGGYSPEEFIAIRQLQNQRASRE
jgi:hypothetical protein